MQFSVKGKKQTQDPSASPHDDKRQNLGPSTPRLLFRPPRNLRFVLRMFLEEPFPCSVDSRPTTPPPYLLASISRVKSLGFQRAAGADLLIPRGTSK